MAESHLTLHRKSRAGNQLFSSSGVRKQVKMTPDWIAADSGSYKVHTDEKIVAMVLQVSGDDGKENDDRADVDIE